METPLFRFLVLCLAATMLGTQIYGLSKSPDETVTGDMKRDSHYLVLMSSSLLLQSAVWALCLYKKSGLDQEASTWGAFTLAVMLVAWIGLSTILTTDTHYVFTGVFITAFLALILIMCYLVWQPLPLLILRMCLVLEIVCTVAMLILIGERNFYLPEQIAFLTYTVIFAAFFWAHPYEEWAQPRPHCDSATQLLLPHDSW